MVYCNGPPATRRALAAVLTHPLEGGPKYADLDDLVAKARAPREEKLRSPGFPKLALSGESACKCARRSAT